jgi:hypothetical protein
LGEESCDGFHLQGRRCGLSGETGRSGPLFSENHHDSSPREQKTEEDQLRTPTPQSAGARASHEQSQAGEYLEPQMKQDDREWGKGFTEKPCGLFEITQNKIIKLSCKLIILCFLCVF